MMRAKMKGLQAVGLASLALLLGGQAAPDGCGELLDADSLGEPSVEEGFEGVSSGGGVMDGFGGFRSDGAIESGFSGHAEDGTIEGGFVGGGASSGLCVATIDFAIQIVDCLLGEGSPLGIDRFKDEFDSAEARRMLESQKPEICPAFEQQFAAAAGPRALVLGAAMANCFDRLALLSCDTLFGGDESAAVAACAELGEQLASFTDLEQQAQSLSRSALDSTRK